MGGVEGRSRTFTFSRFCVFPQCVSRRPAGERVLCKLQPVPAPPPPSSPSPSTTHIVLLMLILIDLILFENNTCVELWASDVSRFVQLLPEQVMAVEQSPALSATGSCPHRRPADSCATDANTPALRLKQQLRRRSYIKIYFPVDARSPTQGSARALVNMFYSKTFKWHRVVYVSARSATRSNKL